MIISLECAKRGSNALYVHLFLNLLYENITSLCWSYQLNNVKLISSCLFHQLALLDFSTRASNSQVCISGLFRRVWAARFISKNLFFFFSFIFTLLSVYRPQDLVWFLLSDLYRWINFAMHSEAWFYHGIYIVSFVITCFSQEVLYSLVLSRASSQPFHSKSFRSSVFWFSEFLRLFIFSVSASSVAIYVPTRLCPWVHVATSAGKGNYSAQES